MNLWDWAILLALAAAVLLALRAVRRGKAGGCSGCSGCAGGCEGCVRRAAVQRISCLKEAEARGRSDPP